MPPSSGEAAAPGRWRTASAAAAVVYVTGACADLILLGLDPVAYGRLHRLAGAAPWRVALAAVVVGTLAWSAGAVARFLGGIDPAGERRRTGLDAAARFLTLAAGLPIAAAVVWPAVRAWWSG